jgi:hypothetical protein
VDSEGAPSLAGEGDDVQAVVAEGVADPLAKASSLMERSR